MKRVQDLIVAADYDAALTLANFASGTDGDINIIDPSTGVAWAAGGESFVIARVCSDSQGRKYVRQSLPVHSGQIQNYVSKDYAASTPKIMTVTIPAITPSAGDVFELFLTDYNDAQYIVGRRRIAYEAVTGDTATLVAAGLAAQINADDSMPNVSATSALGVVTITGAAVDGSGNVITDFRANYEVLFNIALAENLSGVATLATTQNPAKGCGSYREVRKLEEIYKGYKGFTNRVWNSATISNIQYDAASGSTYDVSTIMHKSRFHTNLEGDVPQLISTHVAFVEGAAADTFETALDAAVAGLR